MKTPILLALISLALSVTAGAAEKLIVTGEIFDKEGKEKKFLLERYQDIAGDKTIDRAVYKDLDGKVLVEEKMESKNGQLVRFDIDQKQVKKKAWIVADDKNITFNLKKPRKRNYPQTIKKSDDFIVGLQIVSHIVSHWQELQSGKEIKVKLGVWDRQEAIGFEFEKEDSDPGQVVIKMNPSSMFVRAVVSPIYFVFDAKDKSLIEYRGRTVPKEKRGKSYYDFDGLVRYKSVEAKKAEKQPAAKK